MAISFVQSKTGTGLGTGIATAASAIYTAGNFIVVAVSKNNTVSTITMSNTGTALTWHQAKSQTGNGQSIDIWYAENIVGQTCTVKATSSNLADDIANVTQEFSGVATSASIDKTAGGTGVNASPTSGATAATTTANELIFGALASNDGTNDATLGAGYSNLGTAFASTAFTFASGESKVVAATGAQTATFGMGGVSANWCCAVATFAAAAVGDPTVSTSDTLTTTESTNVATVDQINVSNTLTTTESIQADIPRLITVSDTLTTSESLRLLGTGNIVKSDTLTLSESITLLIPTLFMSISDTLTTTESLRSDIQFGVSVTPGSSYTINGVKVV